MPLRRSCSSLAAVTDSLDGYLARRLGQTSALGAFLDPVADKLMVAVALVLLVSHDPPELEFIRFNPHMLITLTAAVIIGREITISALREWMAEMGARGKVAVSSIGKLKTIFQMTGLSMMLFRERRVVHPGVRAGRVLPGCCGGADPVVDGRLPARGLAGADAVGDR